VAYGIAVVFAPAIGPTLGGWTTDNFTWRWVFLLNVPVGILLSLLAGRVLADPPELVAQHKARLKAGLDLDYIGSTTLIARREQYHQSVLVEHTTSLTSQYNAAVHALQQAYLAYSGSAADALHQAQAQIYEMVAATSGIFVVYAKPPFAGCGSSARLPRPLHPSRRHLEQPPRFSRQARRDLPLQGLSPQRAGAVPHNDTQRRRVHQALLAPRSPKGVSSHPPLRAARQRQVQGQYCTRQGADGRPNAAGRSAGSARHS
jgi:hypothetical protein